MLLHVTPHGPAPLAWLLPSTGRPRHPPRHLPRRRPQRPATRCHPLTPVSRHSIDQARTGPLNASAGRCVGVVGVITRPALSLPSFWLHFGCIFLHRAPLAGAVSCPAGIPRTIRTIRPPRRPAHPRRPRKRRSSRPTALSACRVMSGFVMASCPPWLARVVICCLFRPRSAPRSGRGPAPPGGLNAISPKLHSFATASGPADLADAIGAALADLREKLPRLAAEGEDI